jgi:hypothetical protein
MKYLRHTHNNQILNLCHTRQNLTRDNNKRHWIQRTEKACLKKKKKRREDDGMIQTIKMFNEIYLKRKHNTSPLTENNKNYRTRIHKRK